MFDVVADTGSDSVIVPSCACVLKDGQLCSERCFKMAKDGTSALSSTFSLSGRQVDSVTMETKVPIVVLTFGSGRIAAEIATDLVQVGNVKAKMNDGVLLMVQRELRISGPFEGILGLGLPKRKSKPTDRFGSPFHLPDPSLRYEMHGFLESVGVSHFSMCFNDGKDGVLRLGGPKPAVSLGSVGRAHWGLEFKGITVGGADGGHHSLRPTFCDPTKKGPGQETACGAIPDSGTTVTMAPAAHLELMFNSICLLWKPCRIESELTPTKAKSAVLQSLLLECGSWMGNSSSGLNVLPELHFHLGGAEGNSQVVSLPGSAYVIEMMEDEVRYVRKHLAGFTIEVPTLTGKTRKVCAPAFGEMDYNTERNGPVWILGTPFFYERQVGYNLQSDPPSISFSSSPCGECAAEKGRHGGDRKGTSFLSQGVEMMSSSEASMMPRSPRTTPRHVKGPLRLPHIDITEPL